MVGDGGFEPPTSTMSTWRSTPELIALFCRNTIRQMPSFSSQSVGWIAYRPLDCPYLTTPELIALFCRNTIRQMPSFSSQSVGWIAYRPLDCPFQAALQPRRRRGDKDTQATAQVQPENTLVNRYIRALSAVAEPEGRFAHFTNLIAEPRGLFELQVAGVLEHLLFESLRLPQQLVGRHRLV